MLAGMSSTIAVEGMAGRGRCVSILLSQARSSPNSKNAATACQTLSLLPAESKPTSGQRPQASAATVAVVSDAVAFVESLCVVCSRRRPVGGGGLDEFSDLNEAFARDCQVFTAYNNSLSSANSKRTATEVGRSQYEPQGYLIQKRYTHEKERKTRIEPSQA